MTAGMIGHPEVGQRSEGAPADVALWTLRGGAIGFKDTVGGRLLGSVRLECEMTLKGGETMWDLNARDAADYEDIPAGAGIREGEYRIPPEKTAD